MLQYKFHSKCFLFSESWYKLCFPCSKIFAKFIKITPFILHVKIRLVPRLQTLVDKILAYFASKNLIVRQKHEDDSVKMHVTVMNAKYALPPVELAEGAKRAPPIDCSGLIEVYCSVLLWFIDKIESWRSRSSRTSTLDCRSSAKFTCPKDTPFPQKMATTQPRTR